jgi:hypothetical protein
MNIYQITPDIFRFELYNLNYFKECDTEISGHYTFWYSKLSNQYVFRKHGDYYNLVSILPVKSNPRFPAEIEKEFLRELIDKSIRNAYFYNYDAPRFHAGRYLLDELEEKCDKDENGWGTEHFKHSQDEYYDYVMKINCIFPVDYPPEDYGLDKEYWDNLKAMDTEAIKLLTS